jgi:hypothetical protein
VKLEAHLPAAIAASTATAISTVAVPATATAAAPSTASGTASAPSTAKAATSAPASSATTAFPRGPGFVNDNITAHKIMAVQSLDGAFRFIVAIDLDKSEPAGLA